MKTVPPNPPTTTTTNPTRRTTLSSPWSVGCAADKKSSACVKNSPPPLRRAMQKSRRTRSGLPGLNFPQEISDQVAHFRFLQLTWVELWSRVELRLGHPLDLGRHAGLHSAKLLRRKREKNMGIFLGGGWRGIISSFYLVPLLQPQRVYCNVEDDAQLDQAADQANLEWEEKEETNSFFKIKMIPRVFPLLCC